MTPASTTMTQVEFARHLGVGRSYVTALKKAGRLSFADDGKVLVEDSMAILARSSGAPERAAVVTEKFSDSRDKKEHYAAESARMDYEERCGTLMLASDVLGVIADATTTLRTRLESFPDLLAPQLAAISDEQQIRATLADQIEILLGDLAERFSGLARAPA